MAATRTPGITIDIDGNYFVDKHHRGARICQRLGQTTIEQAEAHLKREVAHVDVGLLHSWFASSECTAGFSSPARHAHASATTTGSTATAESRSTRYR